MAASAMTFNVVSDSFGSRCFIFPCHCRTAILCHRDALVGLSLSKFSICLCSIQEGAEHVGKISTLG